MIKRSKHKGFSLIELVVVIVVLAIISIAIMPDIEQAFANYFYGQQVNDNDWQARIATTKLARDMRTIASSSAWVTADTDTLSFIDMQGNTITYALRGSELLRTFQPAGASSASAEPLAEHLNVNDSAFSYFDRNGNTLTPLPLDSNAMSLIRQAQWMLTISQGSNTTLAQQGVYPRNLLP